MANSNEVMAARTDPPPRGKIVGRAKFLAWVREWRDRCGTNRELARQLGWSETLLSGLIHGRGAIGEETAARFGFTKRTVEVFEPIDDGLDYVQNDAGREKGQGDAVRKQG